MSDDSKPPRSHRLRAPWRPRRSGQRKRPIQPDQPAQSPQSTATGSQPSIFQRIRARWSRAPLAVTFAVYLITYLVTATLLTAWLINVVFSNEVESQFVVALTGDEDFAVMQRLYSGPYLYDEATNELVPASEFPITGSDSLGVFVGRVNWAPEVAVNHRGEHPVYATLDDVTDGDVSLYDWGLNFPAEDMRDEVLEYGGPIAAGSLAAYDAHMRAVRVDVSDELSGTLSADLLVSNVAYYASIEPSQPSLFHVIYVVESLTPFLIYGWLGWAMFRRFYRVHIACPLGEMDEAARRIAAQDLDFEVAPVRGRELGRLASTLEDMRASLLEANRELWRVAEDRRRLNAAFAHDLRTPVTVLKGTIELARMRAAAGQVSTDAQLTILAEQVDRLERYATAMGGLSKLEDRTIELEERPVRDVLDELDRYAREVVAASGSNCALEVVRADTSTDAGADAGAAGVSLSIDMLLVEEVLGNLLRNACHYARGTVVLRCEVYAEGDGCELSLCVTDDGPGFSPEALIRAADPFYSEAKSAEHFGLGLNIARTLARLHGGDVQPANTPKGGAQVTATFACGARGQSVASSSEA